MARTGTLSLECRYDQVPPLFISFEIDCIPLYLFCSHGLIWYLTRKPTIPEIHPVWPPLHGPHCAWGGDGLGIRKAIKKRSNTKPMVAMAMSDIDRCQVLDEGRRDRVPEGCLRVGCRSTCYNGYTRSNEDVPVERTIFSVCFICWHTLSNLTGR